MPLDTPGKRRSALGIMQPWVPALPSPTDSPGVLDQADQQHAAWTYSGIAAWAPPTPPARSRLVVPPDVYIVATDGTVVYHYQLLRLPQLCTYVWQDPAEAPPVSRPLPHLRSYAVAVAPEAAPLPRRLPTLRTYAIRR